MTAFELHTESAPGRTIIRVTGDLDLATAPELERELLGALGGSSAEVVLDLAPVTFLDSSGLRAVLVGAREAKAAGRRLLVLPGDGQALRVIELAQVGEHLELG
jgi:anti-anti-sigma factor